MKFEVDPSVESRVTAELQTDAWLIIPLSKTFSVHDM